MFLIGMVLKNFDQLFANDFGKSFYFDTNLENIDIYFTSWTLLSIFYLSVSLTSALVKVEGTNSTPTK